MCEGQERTGVPNAVVFHLEWIECFIRTGRKKTQSTHKTDIKTRIDTMS